MVKFGFNYCSFFFREYRSNFGTINACNFAGNSTFGLFGCVSPLGLAKIRQKKIKLGLANKISLAGPSQFKAMQESIVWSLSCLVLI